MLLSGVKQHSDGLPGSQVPDRIAAQSEPAREQEHATKIARHLKLSVHVSLGEVVVRRIRKGPRFHLMPSLKEQLLYRRGTARTVVCSSKAKEIKARPVPRVMSPAPALARCELEQIPLRLRRPYPVVSLQHCAVVCW